MGLPGTKERLTALVDKLIEEGWRVVGTKIDRYPLTPAIDAQASARWLAGCQNLVRLLGRSGSQWSGAIKIGRSPHADAVKMLGTLQAIKEAIEHDWLFDVENLVLAGTFKSLLEQAAYLLEQDFYLAAGVLGRAVLEQHLRAWCDTEGCTPTTPRPTIENYKTELYKASHIDKSTMKHVEAMAAVGNDAAHNVVTLTKEDVARLLRDVAEFIAKHGYTK